MDITANHAASTYLPKGRKPPPAKPAQLRRSQILLISHRIAQPWEVPIIVDAHRTEREKQTWLLLSGLI